MKLRKLKFILLIFNHKWFEPDELLSDKYNHMQFINDARENAVASLTPLSHLTRSTRSVPCLLRGSLNTWKATRFSGENIQYF